MQVGDWVFCEFELQQITRVEEERVREVTDGICSHSAYDLNDRCMPLTMPMKRIADGFHWQSKRLHDKGSAGLNFPDIHRWLVEHWVLACSHVEDSTALRADFDLLNTFTNDVLGKQQIDSGYGFALMRTGARS